MYVRTYVATDYNHQPGYSFLFHKLPHIGVAFEAQNHRPTSFVCSPSWWSLRNLSIQTDLEAPRINNVYKRHLGEIVPCRHS